MKLRVVTYFFLAGGWHDNGELSSYPEVSKNILVSHNLHHNRIFEYIRDSELVAPLIHKNSWTSTKHQHQTLSKANPKGLVCGSRYSKDLGWASPLWHWSFVWETEYRGRWSDRWFLDETFEILMMMIDDDFEIVIMMITDWWGGGLMTHAPWHPQDMWMYLELHRHPGSKVRRLRKDAAGESQKDSIVIRRSSGRYDHGMIWSWHDMTCKCKTKQIKYDDVFWEWHDVDWYNYHHTGCKYRSNTVKPIAAVVDPHKMVLHVTKLWRFIGIIAFPIILSTCLIGLANGEPFVAKTSLEV